MRHYFTKDGQRLIPLSDFCVADGELAAGCRKRPDTFTLTSTVTLDTAGSVIVLREDGMMYNCTGSSMWASGPQTTFTIAGIVEKCLMEPDKEKALLAIRQAQKQERSKS